MANSLLDGIDALIRSYGYDPTSGQPIGAGASAVAPTGGMGTSNAAVAQSTGQANAQGNNVDSAVLQGLSQAGADNFGLLQQQQGNANQAQSNSNATTQSTINNTQFQQMLQMRQQYINLAQSLIGSATQLQGPRDYWNFLSSTSGGRNLVNQLYSNNPRPSFSGPTQQATPLDLQAVIDQLGLGRGAPEIGNAVAPGAASANAGSPQTGGGFAVPNTNVTVPQGYQVNPSVWDALGSVGQGLALGAVSKAGGDANQYVEQLNAARPSGSAPRMNTTTAAAPQSAF